MYWNSSINWRIPSQLTEILYCSGLWNMVQCCKVVLILLVPSWSPANGAPKGCLSFKAVIPSLILGDYQHSSTLVQVRNQCDCLWSTLNFIIKVKLQVKNCNKCMHVENTNPFQLWFINKSNISHRHYGFIEF